MGRKYELTWDKSKKRWKKYYRGVQYYFRSGTNKTDTEGYQLALGRLEEEKGRPGRSQTAGKAASGGIRAGHKSSAGSRHSVPSSRRV